MNPSEQQVCSNYSRQFFWSAFENLTWSARQVYLFFGCLEPQERSTSAARSKTQTTATTDGLSAERMSILVAGFSQRPSSVNSAVYLKRGASFECMRSVPSATCLDHARRLAFFASRRLSISVLDRRLIFVVAQSFEGDGHLLAQSCCCRMSKNLEGLTACLESCKQQSCFKCQRAF